MCDTPSAPKCTVSNNSTKDHDIPDPDTDTPTENQINEKAPDGCNIWFNGCTEC